MTDNVSDLKWLFSHLRVMCHSVMVDVITQAKRMEYYTVNTHTHTGAQYTHFLQLFENSIENTLCSTIAIVYCVIVLTKLNV